MEWEEILGGLTTRTWPCSGADRSRFFPTLSCGVQAMHANAVLGFRTYISEHQALIRKCTAYNLILSTDRLARVPKKDNKEACSCLARFSPFSAADAGRTRSSSVEEDRTSRPPETWQYLGIYCRLWTYT